MARTEPVPLDEARLRALALAYAGRYATTRAGLVRYLSRKIRERGWAGGSPAALDELAAQFEIMNYVDDRAVGEARTRALKRKGLGTSRIRETLSAIGIGRDMAESLASMDDGEEEVMALRHAKRRRIGPFAIAPPQDRDWQKWMGIMLRAGHPAHLARAILLLDSAEAQNRLNQHC